jgi:4-hydroxy-L-threonine phosphate dehydrogenase PdxA
MTQPTIALFTGDPAGIGPELVQKLLNNPICQQAAKIILIGQKDALPTAPHASWHPWSGLNAPLFPKATYDAHNGAYMIAALAEGVSLVRRSPELQRGVRRTQCAARSVDITSHIACGTERSEQSAQQSKSF